MFIEKQEFGPVRIQIADRNCIGVTEDFIQEDQVILKNNLEEYKFVTDIENSGKYLDWITKNSVLLFPKRTVQSMYYDTLDFSLYKNSVFDDTDRFKIRFRNYKETPEEIFKEIKNSRDGKFKLLKIQIIKILMKLVICIFKVLILPKKFCLLYKTIFS